MGMTGWEVESLPSLRGLLDLMGAGMRVEVGIRTGVCVGGGHFLSVD
jgi:hypothetical protein